MTEREAPAIVTRLPGEAMESMASSSVSGDPSDDLSAGPIAEGTTAELVEKLRADRLWLLQQIDGGRWPELRLDLAALERELAKCWSRPRTSSSWRQSPTPDVTTA